MKLLKADAKDWWKISKQLLAQIVLKDNILALRSRESWAKLPIDKAATLSEKFASKAGLPDEVVSDFSPIIPLLGGLFASSTAHNLQNSERPGHVFRKWPRRFADKDLEEVCLTPFIACYSLV